jgi:biotin carboxylase
MASLFYDHAHSTHCADAVKAAESIGYPVLIKATGGGGGMGIHKCFSAAEVERYFPLAVSQGEKSFGNGDVFVEKYIERAKHIEVQVCVPRRNGNLHLSPQPSQHCSCVTLVTRYILEKNNIIPVYGIF